MLIDEFEHLRILTDAELIKEQDVARKQMRIALNKKDEDLEAEYLHYLDAIYEELDTRGLLEEAS